ncbi:MAG: hypothetical protein COW42_09920, partial [Deltaproteobacteria bacterium CG17_big_fil_post_rev_8_21_14_2_50_63_7]
MKHSLNLAFGASIVALMSPSIAAAQAVEAEPAQATDADADTEQNTNGIADIVVTAERRSERVQKSSLSIQVLTGPQLADVTRPQ